MATGTTFGTELEQLTRVAAAACDGMPVEMFFPTTRLPAAIRRARYVCQTCPIIARCLDYAVHHDVEGIWAGTTYATRARFRTARGIVAANVEVTDQFPSDPPTSGSAPIFAHNQPRTEAMS